MIPLRNAMRWAVDRRRPRFRLMTEVPRVLRDHSACVMKNCVAQVEFVIAFRIRRGVQVVSLYSRLWNELPVLRFLRRLRRTRDLLVAALAYKFDWDSNRITDSELQSHAQEFDLCSSLLKEAAQELNDNPGNEDVSSDHSWMRFVDKDNMSVWKKVEEGLHTYKIYAKYADVTAIDFFELYLDVENRTKWDDHAVILKKIDSEPSSNSDVIYWETKWPALFSNRDYVFNRRWMIDPVKKVMVIKSKSVQHPCAPAVSGKSRVNEYWSYVVIKPFNDFNEPGLEFSLTYFDNHGANLPSSLTLWVTVNGVPDYISRLRLEALKLKEMREAREAIEAENKRIAEEKLREEEKKRNAAKKDEPPRKPPEDEGYVEPDPVAILLFSIMEKIKETLFELKIDIERRAAIVQKCIESSFR
ncbi:stAR-related lipid transfer protein 7, mitochondrial-like [Cimex lectularius]|uniref:Phosphatidylcholine transfer protein n=1 Tax=Cimex lectularius TaxID=79782 RepID=A0A8I6R9S9_CIMLE|nr:stAR-related lipid transfer protein 7, mitochondrial-like [Cimex lectularius]